MRDACGTGLGTTGAGRRAPYRLTSLLTAGGVARDDDDDDDDDDNDVPA